MWPTAVGVPLRFSRYSPARSRDLNRPYSTFACSFPKVTRAAQLHTRELE